MQAHAAHCGELSECATTSQNICRYTVWSKQVHKTSAIIFTRINVIDKQYHICLLEPWNRDSIWWQCFRWGITHPSRPGSAFSISEGKYILSIADHLLPCWGQRCCLSQSEVSACQEAKQLHCSISWSSWFKAFCFYWIFCAYTPESRCHSCTPWSHSNYVQGPFPTYHKCAWCSCFYFPCEQSLRHVMWKTLCLSVYF